MTEKEKKKGPVIKLVCGAAFILATLGGGQLLYESAQDPSSVVITKSGPQSVRPEQRQKYLDDLVRGVEIPYCDGIVYDHDGSKVTAYIQELITDTWEAGFPGQEKTPKVLENIQRATARQSKQFKEGKYDIKVPSNLRLSGQGRITPLFIGRMFFERPEFKYFIDEDVKHIITVHHKRILEQIANGTGYLSKKEIIEGLKSEQLSPIVVSATDELDAYHFAIRDIIDNRPRISRVYHNMTGMQFEYNLKVLKRLRPGSSDLQKKLIDEAFKRVDDVLAK